MMIEKLVGTTPLSNVQKTNRTNNAEKVSSRADSVSISKEAKEMADAYYLKQVAAETPDVRADRIAEIKAKIQDPNYLNSAVIASAADHLIKDLIF